MTKALFAGATGCAVVLGFAALAASAQAAPTLIIRHAAMNVTIETEDRPDIAVDVYRPNARLPLDVRQEGGNVVIDGHLIDFLTTCHGSGQGLHVLVLGRGDFDLQQMPQVQVHVPRDVVVESDGIVHGVITRSQSVNLRADGCGDWTIANVAGPLTARVSGIGDLRTGSSRSADVSLSGAGHMSVGNVATQLTGQLSGAGAMDVVSAGSADLGVSGSGGLRVGPIAGALSARLSGAGDLKVVSVAGPVIADVSGVGNVDIESGHASTMQADVSGTGHVDFKGVADSLNASVSGIGSVDVTRVTGAVVQRVSGIGSVHVDQHP